MFRAPVCFHTVRSVIQVAAMWPPTPTESGCSKSCGCTENDGRGGADPHTPYLAGSAKTDGYQCFDVTLRGYYARYILEAVGRARPGTNPQRVEDKMRFSYAAPRWS